MKFQTSRETDRSEVLSRRAFVTQGLAAAGLSGIGLSADAAASGMVSTMACPVPCDSLGTTLIHEHILWFGGPKLTDPGYTPIPDELRSESVEFAVSLLNDAARVGIDTLVDLTPHRPIDLYQQIAKRTSVKIIPSTGFYRRQKIPKWMADIDDEKQMEDRMLKEVVEGIDGTSVRAGIIKVASERTPLTDWEKRVFRAAAQVQKATGVAIATHSGSASAGEQYDLLVRTGGNPHRILLSHVDVGAAGHTDRLERLLSIVKQGGYLEVDTFGQDFYTPWSDLTSFLRYFCDAGFANRLFISVDCNWHWENGKKLFEGAEAPSLDPNASKRTYAYMMTDAVPKLLRSGFSQKEIDTFLVDNPHRFFCSL
jgi:phosphotriesterase-related protein